jgi:hypothetical protein
MQNADWGIAACPLSIADCGFVTDYASRLELTSESTISRQSAIRNGQATIGNRRSSIDNPQSATVAIIVSDVDA